jgi:hypothetical protein
MTRLQQRNLRIYLQYRERPMTIAGLVWANRRIYILLLVLFGTVGGFFYNAFGAAIAGYVAVAFLVILVRDIGYYRRSVKIWPVIQQVLDWQKVEQLAASGESVK